MRRIALLGLTLLLPSCAAPDAYIGNPFDGFGGFTADTISLHENPNRPMVDSENMHRVSGQAVAVDPLLPDTGNIWPGPPRPEPTLSDIEREQNQETQPPQTPPPAPPRGSSTPPAPVQPQTMPSLPTPPTTTSRATPIAPTPPPGGVVQTPQGQAVINGNGTYTPPGGGTGTVIDNGNGTVTLINPNGSVQTVPTPH